MRLSAQKILLQATTEIEKQLIVNVLINQGI